MESLQCHVPSVFAVCVSFFIIDFSGFSLSMTKADAPLPLPLMAFLFFYFKCSGCVCMEGVVFYFFQLSRPGELWFCSVVRFTSLHLDLLP